MTTKLKPCPFCGAKVELKLDEWNLGTFVHTLFMVVCPTKDCKFEISGSKKENLLKRWNRRV